MTKGFEIFKKEWLQDFKETQDDIKILSERLNDYIDKVEKVNTVEELLVLCDCLDDLENDLKHIRLV